METPIYRAAYRWTSEELATAWRRHRDTELRPAFVLLVGGFASLLGAMICFVLFYALPRIPGENETPWVALAVPAFALYWIFVRNPALKWRAWWEFKKSESEGLVEWEILTQEIKVWQRGLSYSAMAWKSLVKVVEVQDGFLLYTHPRIFIWLPFRAFEMPEAPERVREIIQASGVSYQKIAS